MKAYIKSRPGVGSWGCNARTEYQSPGNVQICGKTGPLHLFLVTTLGDSLYGVEASLYKFKTVASRGRGI